jgi:hypothetical protein
MTSELLGNEYKSQLTLGPAAKNTRWESQYLPEQ